MLWEPEHGGALTTAFKLGARIYWNAPTREDDIQGQIALVQQVIDGNYQGLVLAPDHAVALITPVRRAMARGLPIVIVGSPLSIPPGNGVAYILNDEEAGGRIAAQRLAEILHGQGTVAILGINPDIAGITTRVRSLEKFVAESYPDIHIVAKRMGSFNLPHEQQVAEETFKAHPDLDAVVSLTSTSTRGAISVIGTRHSSTVKVIAFDPDTFAFDAPSLDSVILEDTQRMGAEAVTTITGKLQGKPMPTILQFQPILVTRETLDTPEVRRRTSMDWRQGPLHWKWSVTP